MKIKICTDAHLHLTTTICPVSHTNQGTKIDVVYQFLYILVWNIQFRSDK